MLIEEVDKKLSGYTGVVTIMCKDFTSFKLRIPGIENAVNVCASIEALSTLGKSFYILLVSSKKKKTNLSLYVLPVNLCCTNKPQTNLLNSCNLSCFSSIIPIQF